MKKRRLTVDLNIIALILAIFGLCALSGQVSVNKYRRRAREKAQSRIEYQMHNKRERSAYLKRLRATSRPRYYFELVKNRINN